MKLSRSNINTRWSKFLYDSFKLYGYTGLLIWYSLDLVNWNPAPHGLTDYIGNAWAPDFLNTENCIIYSSKLLKLCSNR